MIGIRRPRSGGAHLAAMLVATLWLATASSAAADDRALEIDWRTSAPMSGEVVDGWVRVSTATGGTFPLVSVDAPGLGPVGYEVAGEVRYDGVEGRGYLEMWSIFPGGDRFFSRTLGTDGPMAALAGSSDGRAFQLPFILDGASPPERIEINVVLPGAGTVEVGPLELIRLTSSAGLGGEESSGAWVPDRLLGAFGAVLGSTIGLLGAVIGTLVAKQRARGFVMAAMTAATIAGVVFIGVSIVALIAVQPIRLVFFILLPGVILAVVFGTLLPGVRRTYAEAELRRMRALDRS